MLRSVKAASTLTPALTDLARDGRGHTRSGRRKAFGEVEPRKWPARDEAADGCTWVGVEVLHVSGGDSAIAEYGARELECGLRVMKIHPRWDAIEVRAINLIDFSWDA